MTPRPPRRVDRSALQGLAHPLRVQLLDALAVYGPATASDLGRRLGESSGATSYHLRQLERHRFVETDPDRGTGRERWWRLLPEDTRVRAADFESDPVSAAAHRLVVGEWQRARQTRLAEWTATRHRWPAEWRAASHDSNSHLRLTAAEAQQLFDEMNAVVIEWADRQRDRYNADLRPDQRVVEVQLVVFPNGPEPDGES